MTFYTPHINTPYHTLSEEESTHAIRVLRLTAGSEITLVDGKGHRCTAHIIEPHHRHCRLQITTHHPPCPPPPYTLHIGISPPKNAERLEWFIEKATEIGISEITPLLCEHSERRQINSERLQRILISAMKQSQRAHLPILHSITPLNIWIEAVTGKACCYIAHCDGPARRPLAIVCPAGHSATIAIGPEGDFSASELTHALAHGFEAITLGEARLRTETAGIVACHSIHLINQQARPQ